MAIEIYTNQEGVQLRVNLEEETVWLTQKQMADLFDKDTRTISEHINNIFKEGELIEYSVIRNFRTTASDGKTYDTKHYNLDVIISVGYRVRSKQGIKFRQWASNVIKNHLIKGYSVYRPRLEQQGLKELNQTVELLQKTFKHHHLTNEIGSEAIHLIVNYSKTWSVLLAYDENRLAFPEKESQPVRNLEYEDANSAIRDLKFSLSKSEATQLFGQEIDNRFESILKNIDQTFDEKPLYKSIEERSAHLLYFIIKDHPFVDGNKRIGCLIFLLYLKLQDINPNLNDNGLMALALLIAESDPSQKEILVKLITNILSPSPNIMHQSNEYDDQSSLTGENDEVEEEKIVTFDYPVISGIKAEEEKEGYELKWPRRERVPELLLQGYELVYEREKKGKKKYKLICKDSRMFHKDLVLMKKKRDQ